MLVRKFGDSSQADYDGFMASAERLRTAWRPLDQSEKKEYWIMSWGI